MTLDRIVAMLDGRNDGRLIRKTCRMFGRLTAVVADWALDLIDSEAERDAARAGFRMDPAGVSDPPEPPTPAGSTPFTQWMVPAVLDVLADHRIDHDGEFFNCYWAGDDEPHGCFTDQMDWREHVAPLITARIEKAGGGFRAPVDASELFTPKK